jgi:alpha-galactosidase
MKKKGKIVIIGGGSLSWGPLFVRDLVVTPELAGSTIVLHDIDAEAMDLVYRVGELAIQAGGYDFQLERSGNLADALSGADVVILTITTGGLQSMRHDLEIPARYGIFQSVGDTVGPGGLSRGLRNIPVVVEIARQMEVHCPDAWLLNYTNPMTMLTRAVTRETVIKTVGLCHEWHGVRAKLARIFNAREEDFQPRIAGINHLIWLLDLYLDDRSLMPELHAMAGQLLSGDLDLDPDYDSPFADHGRVKARLLTLYGALPVAGDRHVAEFFPHFLSEATQRGRTYRVTLTSVEDRYGWYRADKARLESILAGKVALRPLL